MITLWLACAPAPPEPALAWETTSFEAMHTRIDVTLRGADSEARAGVEDAFREVEGTANEWQPGAPLAEVNAGAGHPVQAPADLRALVRRGLELAAVTDGAFDPTWAALWDVWDFSADPPRLPTEDEIAARLPHVDWRNVVVDDEAGTITLLDAEAKLGLGGIAKGWALDHAAAGLRQRGIDDFLLSAGGQVMAGGTRDGRAWQVGLREPRGTRDDYFLVLPVSDASVSTSGDYERYFEVDGVRYHHILDPRTGWPARGARSASVVCPDATTADALSTALLVKGATEGLALAERLGVQAVIVDDAGRVHRSPPPLR
jgi:FAD:protein FMN transferase